MWSVRRQVAASAGELPEGGRVDVFVRLLTANGRDPIIVDAAVSSLRGLENQVLTGLLQSSAPAASAPTEAVMHLAAAETKAGNVAVVERSISVIADASRPLWQRTALLQGLDLALPSAGAAAGRGRGGGGIGLPGLSVQRSPVAISPGRGMSLGSEPAALARVASGTDQLAETAARVLAKLNWPGRPAPAAVAMPLTPAEQQRYTAGAAVYKNVCVGCHQEDGRGNATLGANLVDSAFVTGADPSPNVRVILGGKEGSDRDDAAARRLVERRAGGVGCHVYSSRVGSYGHGRDAARGERSSGLEPESLAPVDRGGASARARARWARRTRSGAAGGRVGFEGFEGFEGFRGSRGCRGPEP